MPLQSNAVSHWLDANLESTLNPYTFFMLKHFEALLTPMLCLQGVWMGPLHAQWHAVVRQGVFPDAQRYHLLPQAWSTQVQCQVSGTMSFSCCGLTMPHDHKNEMHLTLDYLIHCLCYHGADGILEPTAVFCVFVPWPYNNVTLGTVGWVGLWGFLWWAPSAKRKDQLWKEQCLTLLKYLPI